MLQGGLEEGLQVASSGFEAFNDEAPREGFQILPALNMLITPLLYLPELSSRGFGGGGGGGASALLEVVADGA